MIAFLITLIITIAIAAILVNSFKFGKQDRIYTSLRLGIAHRNFGNLLGWHINDPAKPYFDKRYPDFEIIPDQWGSPEKYEAHILFHKEDIDSDLKGGFLAKGTSQEKKFVYKKGLLESYGCFFAGGLWPLYQWDSYETEITRTMLETDLPIENSENSEGQERKVKVIWREKDSGHVIVSEKIHTDHIRFQFQYPIVCKELETGGPADASGRQQMIPINAAIMNTVRARNAMRMRFKTDNWPMQHLSSAKAVAREWVGNLTIEGINKVKNEQGDALSLALQMRVINTKTANGNDGVTDMFGFEVAKTNFEGYEISGENAARILQASNTVYIAEQEAAASERKAEAEAVAIKKKGEADAHVIRKKGDAEAAVIAKKSKQGLNPNKEILAKAIGDHKGSLSIGNGLLTTFEMNDSNKTENPEN